MAEAKLSVVDKLIRAALDLEREGRIPFTAEDLVVSARKVYPDTFGLAGYTDAQGQRLYPDSNPVSAEIMGSKPIRQKGWLTKVGNKMYQLTEAGRQHGAALSGSDLSGTEKIGLGRDSREEIERVLKAKAAE